MDLGSRTQDPGKGAGHVAFLTVRFGRDTVLSSHCWSCSICYSFAFIWSGTFLFLDFHLTSHSSVSQISLSISFGPLAPNINLFGCIQSLSLRVRASSWCIRLQAPTLKGMDRAPSTAIIVLFHLPRVLTLLLFQFAIHVHSVRPAHPGIVLSFLDSLDSKSRQLPFPGPASVAGPDAVLSPSPF